MRLRGWMAALVLPLLLTGAFAVASLTAAGEPDGCCGWFDTESPMICSIHANPWVPCDSGGWVEYPSSYCEQRNGSTNACCFTDGWCPEN
jgi:hypothetical protein